MKDKEGKKRLRQERNRKSGCLPPHFHHLWPFHTVHSGSSLLHNILPADAKHNAPGQWESNITLSFDV